MWLQNKLEEKMIRKTQPNQRKSLSQYSDQKIGEVTIKNLFGGLRGNDLLVSDVSYVDPNDGHPFSRLLGRRPCSK